MVIILYAFPYDTNATTGRNNGYRRNRRGIRERGGLNREIALAGNALIDRQEDGNVS